MNSVDREIIGIVVILILCTSTLVKSEGGGAEAKEAVNSKQTAVPVNVKEEQSRIKGEDKISVEYSGANNAVKASNLDESTVNHVLSLDGQKGYLRVPDSQSLRSFKNAITIEAWFKASSFQEEHGFINTILRKNIANGLENFFLRIRNVNGRSVVQMSIGYDIEALSVPYEFSTGTWYHLAGTYDGSAMTAFVNGISIKSQKVSGPPYIDQSDMFIGKGDPEFSDGEYFHGELDEIRIWNLARSQEEIRAAMSTPLTGKEEALIAYWNFDDGTTKDLTGHGNDAILGGNTQIVGSPRSKLAQPEQKSKLVAWWKLDEVDGNDVADSSGNDYTGRLVGNPQWKPVGGKVNGALEFDGIDDYVEIDNESAFDISGAVTVAAWFKVNRFDKRWQAIVTKGDSSWRLSRTAGQDTLAFHCTGIDSTLGGWNNGIEGKKNVNDGQWHHAVGVYDGSIIFLYTDGAIDNSGKASGSIRVNDSAVLIGDNSEAVNREWNGLIDEVCIIGGAVDANGVRALYSGEDPMAVARTAIFGSVEGDWQIISDQVSQKVIIEIRRDSDSNLTAGVFAEAPDGGSQSVPLDEITFENGKLYFEMTSNQGVFEGTMKEDGLTIEGQFQQQGQTMAIVLKRVDAVPSEVAQTSQEKLQDRTIGTSGTSNIATTLILLLVLVGVVGVIILFFVKASIR